MAFENLGRTGPLNANLCQFPPRAADHIDGITICLLASFETPIADTSILLMHIHYHTNNLNAVSAVNATKRPSIPYMQL
jgi:hypothetical protein